MWEFADPTEQHLWGRVAGDGPLDIGGYIHPERITTQRRAEIANLDHRLRCARDVEQVACLQVAVSDAFVLEPPQPTDHMEIHGLHHLGRDVVQRVIPNILPRRHAFGWLHVKAYHRLLGIDLC